MITFSISKYFFYFILLAALTFSGFNADDVFADVIIDNGDPQTSSTGDWNISGGTDPFGADSYWSRDGSTYTWTFTPTESGYHEVSMWWTEWSSSSKRVPVEIEHFGGTDTFPINQQQNGGKWNVLDQYQFEAGVSYNITITAQPGPSSTCADAVQFVYVPGGNVPPVASIDAISPNPALPGQEVTLSGHGVDIDGTVVNYEWESSMNGIIPGNAETVVTSTLSVGVHTISLSVQDNEGDWSDPVTQTLVVGTSPAEIIIDNGDPETSSTGTWNVSGGPDPWDPDDPAATSLWNRGGNTYKWTFTPVVSGNYDFSMWWTEFSSRSSNVPVFIEFSGGTDTVYINQQENGGQWNFIDQYLFNAGVSYDITITSQPSPSSTSADAVRFVMAALIPPGITGHPLDQSVTEDNAATFSVAATGSSPLDYQWQRGGVDILGATGDMYTTPATTLADNGALFSCVVSNTAGSAISNAATLTVNAAIPPGITSHPSDKSVTEGDKAIFSVAATGSSPLSYQWQRDGENIPGATDAIYTTPAATLLDSGTEFRCVVTNTAGSATSNAAKLTVNVMPPDITTHPSDKSVTENGTATFSVAATGSSPLSYQWQRDGENILDETDSIYTVPVATLLDNGAVFRCIVTNTAGSVTSNDAVLSVTVTTPPRAFNDKADTTRGTAVVIDVVANDTDSDGSIVPSSCTVTSGPSSGTIVEQVDGTVLYTPNSGYTGVDTFIYTVNDDQGAESNPATVEVTVGIILDNGDQGTSSTGPWKVSGGAGPYGTDSLWSRDGNTYTWTFTPDVSGNYKLSMWSTYVSSRSDNIPVSIEHWGGSYTVEISQQSNPSKWRNIGTYPYIAGESYDITIISPPGPESTCADAVRFVHVPSNVSPVAVIDTIGPNPALPGDEVTFSGSGTDFEGTVTGYKWNSTLDGPLSDSATFSTSSLSEGVHSIFFSVQDNDGDWSQEIHTTVDVNDSSVETTEHIFFVPAYATSNRMPYMISRLQDMGATLSGGVWTYINSARNKRYRIHPVDTTEEWINALKTEDAVIVYFGHSNYGLGQLIATPAEFNRQVIEDIMYVDDDRIVNISSPVVHVNISGMRTGQAYPHWWSIYKDGTDALAPYDWGDPKGDPVYNYYPTYQLPGDPMHYKIETVRKSAIERFPDWRNGPAWYDPDGNPPDPSNPDHLQYYITNSTPWSPSFERVGNWTEERSGDEFFRENYETSAAGSGADQATWRFSIPVAGNYNIYAWWASSSSRATNAPFTVNHSSGSTTVRKSQRVNGGQWNKLDDFYFDVGDFSVVLTDDANGAVVADGIRIEHVDNPPEVLKAGFAARPLSGPAPLAVYFDSENVGDVDSFEWKFGDGNTNGTRSTVTHTYAQPGTYTVTYTINGPLGSDTTTEVAYITVGSQEGPLKAEFDSQRSQHAIVPYEARFRDRSLGDIVSWEWDLDGDGSVDSTEEIPSINYTVPGIYTITLTVTDTNGNTDTEVKENFVRMSVFDKNIDNVDYPMTHYSSKNLILRKELEVTKEELKYKRLFYGGCDSAHYYSDTFQRGVFHFATSGTSYGFVAMADYVQGYVEGKSDYELWELIQATEPLYDYYDFSKPPSQQW